MAGLPGGNHFSADLKLLVLAGLFTALTAVGSLIKFPIFHVPVTLQTFFVLLAGNVLGAYYGSLSQVAYLMLGLAGVPLFAQGGGIGYVLKPTFGYLAAFPIAAGIVGILTRRTSREALVSKSFLEYVRLVSINLAGCCIIFSIGLGYLYINLNFLGGGGISFSDALIGGALIFLPGDLIKVLMIAIFIKKLPYILLPNKR